MQTQLLEKLGEKLRAQHMMASPVFETMLHSGMRESTANESQIKLPGKKLVARVAGVMGLAECV